MKWSLGGLFSELCPMMSPANQTGCYQTTYFQRRTLWEKCLKIFLCYQLGHPKQNLVEWSLGGPSVELHLMILLCASTMAAIDRH